MSHLTKLPPLVEMDAPEAAQRGRGAKRPGAPAATAQQGPSIRERLSAMFASGGAKVGLVVVCVAVIGFGAWRALQEASGPPPQWPKVRVMNPETGEKRWFYTAPGAQLPAGFHPVEYCFQNACGPAGGTPVVLNLYLGKEEPTSCPKCGATVVGLNPRPPEHLEDLPADWK